MIYLTSLWGYSTCIFTLWLLWRRRQTGKEEEVCVCGQEQVGERYTRPAAVTWSVCPKVSCEASSNARGGARRRVCVGVVGEFTASSCSLYRKILIDWLKTVWSTPHTDIRSTTSTQEGTIPGKHAFNHALSCFCIPLHVVFSPHTCLYSPRLRETVQHVALLSLFLCGRVGGWWWEQSGRIFPKTHRSEIGLPSNSPHIKGGLQARDTEPLSNALPSVRNGEKDVLPRFCQQTVILFSASAFLLSVVIHRNQFFFSCYVYLQAEVKVEPILAQVSRGKFTLLITTMKSYCPVDKDALPLCLPKGEHLWRAQQC